MLKKFMLPILIVSMVLQILVPIGMIVYGNKADDDLQINGKEFKVKVYVQHIYDGSIDYKFYDSYNWYKLGYYATVKEDGEGYASIFAEVDESKPKTDDYICITRENKEKLAEFQIDSDYTSWRVDEETAYLVIKVYKGDFEILDLYMDGIPAKEWVEAKAVEEEKYENFEEDVNLFENA